MAQIPFIELPTEDGIVLLNVNSISRVIERENGCSIFLFELNKGDGQVMFTTMSYQDLKHHLALA